jgi:hypothetical protein
VLLLFAGIKVCYVLASLDSAAKCAKYVVWALGNNDKQPPFHYEIYEDVGVIEG